jgi:hypothetical protein
VSAPDKETQMPGLTASDQSKRLAFGNVAASVDHRANLPDQVFRGGWSCFAFFMKDFMVGAGDFAAVIRDFLRAEGATVACLVNLSETPSLVFESAAAIYLDGSIDGSEYDRLLQSTRSEHGFLYTIDVLACASNIGDWCIYSEGSNEIGVVALRRTEDFSRFADALSGLHAESLEVLSDGDTAGGTWPFTDAAFAAWRELLGKNYPSRPT